ncbi:hypothetical protein MMC30_001783 [Trapelia coarctata]|nr:hypothetical protein [Trapelia coarctata]
MFSIIQPSKHDIYDFISYKHSLKDAAKGKKVLITGAGTGIGKAIARHYALAGASTLILAGRRSGPLEAVKAGILEHSPDCQILCVPTDVTDKASVAKLFEEAGQGGNIDILINNAGVVSSLDPIGLGNQEMWWEVYVSRHRSDCILYREVNVKGTYLATGAYLESLGGEPGIIINTTSIGAHTTLPGFSAYGSSKSALDRITEFTAADHNNITCIAFHPGGILDTEMAAKAPAYLVKYLTDSVELSAATAVYLSTPKAAFLNGRFVNANWDMEELGKLEEKITKEDLLRTRIMGVGAVH